jgi:hypothetical protein
MMSSLVSSYVDAINHGGVPDIKKGWGYVVEESLKIALLARFAAIAAAQQQPETLRPWLSSSQTRSLGPGRWPPAAARGPRASTLHNRAAALLPPTFSSLRSTAAPAALITHDPLRAWRRR